MPNYGPSKGAKTKGWIRNNATKEKLSFQFNPEGAFSYSRGVEYSDIIAPGMQYPLTQFAHGNARSFPLDLMIYDHTGNNGLHEKWMLFLGALLTPETNNNQYKKPPDFTFCYGYFIRRCVLENLEIKIEQYNKRLKPVRTHFILQIRQVSP